ncbi:TolC family protein [Pontibacter silvestris]|uniref:TolC family protein n=1 Tax=Pontibacter silvestris TaxID=2305183 RepID=A0ABW4X3F3_9BACT|nr:TolC family protein [Pontibacter silvestris]MCC9138333.1 TolC family protein [Pontibacter silvestris]
MKYDTKIKLIVLSLLFLLINQVQAQDTPQNEQHLTLEEAWKKAEDNNKKLQMQLLKVQASEEYVKDAHAERLPELSAGAEYARISNMPVFESGLFHEAVQPPVIHKTYGVEAEAYLNLYNGHKTRTHIEAEEVAHQLVEEQKDMTASEIKLRVAAIYLDLQRNIVFKDLIEKNIQESQKRLEQINELHKNGVVLKSDQLRAELQLSKQQMTLVEIKNNIELANQKLNIMIGLPETVQIKPEDESDATDLAVTGGYEAYLNEALNEAHELKVSRKETELSELHLKAVQAGNKPKLGLFGHYGYSYPQIFLYPYTDAGYAIGQAGVKLSYPISSLYHNKHKEAAATIDLQRRALAHSDAEDKVRQDVKEAFVRYQESNKRVEVAELNIKQATESYRIVNNTYFNQLALLTDLLDADTQLLQSRFELASAQIATQLKYYQLLNTIGKL